MTKEGVDAVTHAGGLPDYAAMLAAYHRAYAAELRAMVAGLPIPAGGHVLELACGDGVYARWLAERAGQVTALDISPAFLGRARGNAAGHGIDFVAGDVARLPFADDTFDLVWCAQSLYSLPEPVESVDRMRRVTRPGGAVAVLENDTLHHILLAWPVEVELAVRAAELKALIEEDERPRKYYVGRRLNEVFRTAGLERVRKTTWATNRQAPFGPDERAYLGAYLHELRGRARPHLSDAMRARFDRLTDPGSDEYLLDREDTTVTCLDHVVCGWKPAPGSSR